MLHGPEEESRLFQLNKLDLFTCLQRDKATRKIEGTKNSSSSSSLFQKKKKGINQVVGKFWCLFPSKKIDGTSNSCS